MTNLLEQGAAWLAGQRARCAGRTVTYCRGEQSVELVATVGRTPFEQVDTYGVVHRVESRDYLIIAADLVLGGVVRMPRVGDRIRETAGDQVRVFEVMAPEGEPPYRNSDPDGITLRIHTKHVATEGV